MLFDKNMIEENIERKSYSIISCHGRISRLQKQDDNHHQILIKMSTVLAIIIIIVIFISLEAKIVHPFW